MTDSGYSLIRLLKQENFFIFSVILLLIAFSWFYVFFINHSMTKDLSSMEKLSSPQMGFFGFKDFLSLLIMWSFMMLAMMIPSATPMILVFASVYKKKLSQGQEFVPTWIFLSGYGVIWILFSFATALAQFFLHNFALITDELKLVNPVISGSVLIAAGVYQFTPIKNICLKNCQGPLSFIMGNWRYGKKGAFLMGVKHGSYCVGCCWVLMLLLFAAGVMNLLWVILISLFIFIEKIFAKGRGISYVSGTALILFGLWVIKFKF